MKRILAVMMLLFLCVTRISADEAKFDSTTEVLLVANGTFWLLEVGLGLDKSFLPHLVSSLVVTGSVPVLFEEGGMAMHIEPVIKYFFRRDNKGPYLLIGPSIRVLSNLEPPLSLMLAGVGFKKRFLRILVFDMNLSIPTLMIFQLPKYDESYYDYYDYAVLESRTGSLKMSLGFYF